MRIRQLTTIAEMTAAVDLFDALWPPGDAGSLIQPEMLRALTKAGNYLAGAFDEDRLVGACLGFFGPPASRSMHSHVAGVSAQHAGIGLALKLDQREWALRHGVETISWTFDPLVGRNAYFNLTKLGATAAEYLPDFYGEMTDGVNQGAGSDRLLVSWDLAAPVGRPVERGDAVIVLGRAADGGPEIGSLDDSLPASPDGVTLLIATPSDIAALRRTDPAMANAWRVALREVLSPLVGEVAGFDRAGFYVVRQKGTGR
ncbi:GNAT family N-acetyltransferase [Actinoplanes sp. NPDC051633]|uniref:GNAT family N-acetyltransferase n=1 Tax=Actinoplanes sp. NPDC051633 TaxID=3155670 RepID=UPI00341BC06E